MEFHDSWKITKLNCIFSPGFFFLDYMNFCEAKSTITKLQLITIYHEHERVSFGLMFQIFSEFHRKI